MIKARTSNYKCGVWCVVCGVWCVVYGAWCVVRGVVVRWCAVVCGGVQVRLRAACVCGCVAPLPSGRHTNRESTCTVFVAVLTAGFGG